MSSYKPLFWNSHKRYAKEALNDGYPAGIKETIFIAAFLNCFSMLHGTELPYHSFDLPLW